MFSVLTPIFFGYDFVNNPSEICQELYIYISIHIYVVTSVLLQISAKAPLADVIQVKSCVISPLSDPKKSPFWTVISNGCSSDPSLNLGTKTEAKDEDETEDDSELEEETREVEGLERGRHSHEERKGASMDQSTCRRGKVAETQNLRFSFILRPVFNNSVQFLHCSLHLCLSKSTRGETMKEDMKKDCQGGIRIPPLVSRSHGHQVKTLKHGNVNMSQHRAATE